MIETVRTRARCCVDRAHGPLKLALTACLLVLLANADAGRVERFDEGLWGAADLAIPGGEEGRWRTRTQLVWDDVESKLTRRTYRIWDPFPSLDLDVVWKPDDTHLDRPGALAGSGTLLWVRRGAPAYDGSAIIASYQGKMSEGRADGEGSYWHRSGLTYRGEWREGVMAGQGRLLLPNGDEYVGEFRGGLREGSGVYVDAQGNLYEGGFAAGDRDGEGTVVRADAVSYRALFQAGAEVPGTRVSLPMSRGSELTHVAFEDARVGVIVDRRPVYGERKPLLYTSASEGETLRIFPDHQRFMDVWRGRGEIQLTQAEEAFGSGFGPRLLDGNLRFEPVPLIFELENRSGHMARVVGAFLDVAKSVTDTEPLVQISVGASYGDNCGYAFDSNIGSEIRLENFGWTPAENARIQFAFTDAEGRRTKGSTSRDIGTIDKAARIDFINELKENGFRDDVTRSERFSCSSDDAARCAREVAATGVFGAMGDLVWVSGGMYFLVNVRGTLQYDWRDAGGAIHHKTSRFTVPLLLAQKVVQAECGELGMPTDIHHEPFRFRLDQESYRISVPLRDDVPPGVTARWRVKLDADKSSSHAFRFVLQLADGREIASRPIQLLFARPATLGEPEGGGGS